MDDNFPLGVSLCSHSHGAFHIFAPRFSIQRDKEPPTRRENRRANESDIKFSRCKCDYSGLKTDQNPNEDADL